MDKTLLFDGKVRVAPSILSADFLNLESSVNLVSDVAGCIHVDVMDGHFVPNLTIGPCVVKALRKRFDSILDVHLMIDNPESTVDWYLDAGADIATVQVESLVHSNRLMRHIRERGALAGIALNPGTPVWMLRDIVEEADLVLVMSVNPGFGGQSFIPSAVRKVREVADLCASLGVHPVIEVDGGIGVKTAPLVCEAGARLLVAGSAVFSSPDPRSAVVDIQDAGSSALR